MINFLSDSSWINPQIDVLLFLQNLRVGHLEIFDKFFLSITIFGEFWLPTLICAITYWCFDFRAGIYLFSLEGINAIFTHIFKMIACVYRPWILSDKIHPSQLAVPFAAGYSFPSGHSAMSSSVLGGVAYLLRQKKFICACLICLILLIGFSRLWLGVHTPQDVICGLLTGLILVFALNKMIDWAEKKHNRYLWLTFFVTTVIIAAIIYIRYFATYKMEYIDGKLLVDPKKAIYFTTAVFGYILGILDGCFLCRRYFPFNPKDVSIKRRIIRGLIGGTFVIIITKFVIAGITMNTVHLRFALPIMFVTGIFITLVYPLIFQYFDKKHNR